MFDKGGSSDSDAYRFEAAAHELAEVHTQINKLQARQLALLAELDRTAGELDPAADLVAAIMRLSVPAAMGRLAHASRLVEQLPATMKLAAAGELPGWHAETIAAESLALPDGTLPAYEQRVLKRAATQTITQLRQAIRRAKLALDPATAEQKRQSALAEREVWVKPLEHGLAGLWFTHSAEVIQTIADRLAAAVHALPVSDERCAAQQRADLFADAILASLDPRCVATPHGIRPNVQVVVTAGTLLGADEEPGWLAGHGPISAEHARHLAGDPSGTWQRILLDPDTGQVLDANSTTYKPSSRLFRFLAARDALCVFPGCCRRAQYCDVDHVLAFFVGGLTTRSNTALLCRRHNNLKRLLTYWRYILNADGSKTWTHVATGQTFTSHPPERWSDPDPPPS